MGNGEWGMGVRRFCFLSRLPDEGMCLRATGSRITERRRAMHVGRDRVGVRAREITRGSRPNSKSALIPQGDFLRGVRPEPVLSNVEGGTFSALHTPSGRRREKETSSAFKS